MGYSLSVCNWSEGHTKYGYIGQHVGQSPTDGASVFSFHVASVQQESQWITLCGGLGIVIWGSREIEVLFHLKLCDAHAFNFIFMIDFQSVKY